MGSLLSLGLGARAKAKPFELSDWLTHSRCQRRQLASLVVDLVGEYHQLGVHLPLIAEQHRRRSNQHRQDWHRGLCPRQPTSVAQSAQQPIEFVGSLLADP